MVALASIVLRIELLLTLDNLRNFLLTPTTEMHQSNISLQPRRPRRRLQGSLGGLRN
jgi:hypothetical protein